MRKFDYEKLASKQFDMEIANTVTKKRPRRVFLEAHEEVCNRNKSSLLAPGKTHDNVQLLVLVYPCHLGIIFARDADAEIGAGEISFACVVVLVENLLHCFSFLVVCSLWV